MEDPITSGGGSRPDVSSAGAAVRVVLAEADAPSSLHYLLEAEGFRVVGCASDDVELRRVLQQDVDPDVVVLDADVTATAVQVAREVSPDSHVIVIWPDGVQLPTAATERVPPRLVYEQLGPAIRRAASERRPMVPLVAAAPVGAVGAGAGAALHVVDEPTSADGDPRFGRAASRVSVTSIVLIAAIVLTMGASFALEGWSGGSHAGPSGTVGPRPSVPVGHTATTSTGRPSFGRPHPVSPMRSCTQPPCRHHDGKATNHRPTHPVIIDQGSASAPEPPSVPGDSNGSGGGNQGGQGDQGGGGEGDQGGGQGDQGGGQGDQGGDDQGGDDQGGGGQGDQGGSQGDQGGDGQGDQGGDQQGDQGSQN